MARSLGVLLLLAAVGVAWLSLGDRVSPLALHVVEWEGRLGAPAWALAGVAGLLLLVFGGKRDKVLPADAPRRARPAPRPEAAAPLGEGWQGELAERAAALSLPPGCSVTINPGAKGGVPVELEVQRRTPAQARRAVEVFAGFLAGAPTPPRARVRFVDCPAPSVPRAKQVAGALRPCFPADAVTVTGTADRVELIFRDPDPRWSG